MSVPLPDIERILFFNGERLTADDLNAVDNAERDMRWLHNRALHGWGIATGLGVTGKTGDRSVQIAPGMAIDSTGREIILSTAMTMGIPVISGSNAETMYYLTAAYLGDAGQKVLEQRAAASCVPGSGATRLANDPVIQWKTPAAVAVGKQIILATIWIKNCKLSRDVSGAARRLLAPPTTFPVYSGQTDPATTIWLPFFVGLSLVGYTTAVDTSAAQFGGVPSYFAQLVGGIYLPGAPGPLLAIAQTSVADASATSFSFNVLLPAGAVAPIPVNPPAVLSEGPTIFQQLGWSVSWMGVQA